ncbi:D-aminoacylase [Polycladomyces sp. WAk]|uniref:D-aminoacylase n=1 Tax=Polycladomyces zharkentensis TaxID=2807616 RepID=A0ABS2WN13_9BACL|nr:D-aminoacylase [Polycladomyces sp. WAk]MBN2910836.1 D-aminoacylase [Polycladomyces sp. WAk]
MLDLLIKNGRIVDGTGNPWFWGDVGIKNGMITHVGLVDIEAKEVIDAGHQIVSPGFIDGHSHADLLVLQDPHHDVKLQQGVTTEVVGNCGLAPAPFVKERGDLLKRYIEPVIGNTPWAWPWESVEEYIQTLMKAGISENVSTYVAHGALRIAVMGFENRPATKREMQNMKDLLEEGMKAGAIGLSIGLLYAPGRYASKEELAELCSVLPKYNGLLSSHIRGEGNNLIQSIKEVIWIAEKSGVPLHISHLKAAGKRNWGSVAEALHLIDDARARGLDVTCDVYPYNAGSTMLTTLLPPWALEGGVEACLSRLRDLSLRKRIKQEMSEEQEDWDNLIVSTGWQSVIVSSVSEKNQHLEGRSILDISQELGKDPCDTALDLLLEEEGNVSIVYFHMSNDDVEQVIKYDHSLIISDSLGCVTGKPHPRLYGTYPRLFAKYVREKKILSLEQAVRKVTSFPAQRFNLGKRGLLRPGYHADITIFDPNQIMDTATYQEPMSYPDGIRHVIVNGVKTIEHKKNLHANGGCVIQAHRSLYACCDH